MSEKIVCRDCGADFQHSAGVCIDRLKAEAERWHQEAVSLRHLVERERRAYEITAAERDGYRKLVERFCELQAEAAAIGEPQ